VYGHTLQVPAQVEGRRTARFTFASLCGQAYGPADFIELARMYSVIFLSDIPRMDLSNRNEVRAMCDCASSSFYGAPW
jgi:predicted ATPase